MRIDCGYAADFFAIREYGTSRQFIIFFRTHCIPSGKYSVSSGKQCGLRASHMKVVSAVPNEPQVRTGTLKSQRKLRKQVVGTGGTVGQANSAAV